MLQIPVVLTIQIVADYLVTLALLIISFNFFKFFGQPVKRGFFCDDETLKYPYHEDTVDGTMLNVLTLCLPICIMILGEGVLFIVYRCQTKCTQYHGYFKGFLRLHYNITPFLCGFALHACTVHLAKIIVGRLRPHFFEICQPYRLTDGTTCDNPKNIGIYIEDYACENNNVPDIGMLYDLHRSFPSGHASYIFYGMVFTVLYLKRFAKSLCDCGGINVGVILMVLQMLCAILAWFVAVTRVRDYKHHWSDVLVGILLGTAVACAVSHFVGHQLESVKNLSERKQSSSSDTTSATTLTPTTTKQTFIL